jgi:uncharacterized protein YqgV (UPF0045/DUF77 family)
VRKIKRVSAAVLKGGMDKATGTVEKATAAVLFQGFNTLLRSIEIQRKLDHQQELEDQVAELRSRLKEVKRSRWGV